jgi:hypothetical protein
VSYYCSFFQNEFSFALIDSTFIWPKTPDLFKNSANLKLFQFMHFYCKPDHFLIQNRKRKNQFQKKIEKGRGQANRPRPESRPDPASRRAQNGTLRHVHPLTSEAHLSAIVSTSPETGLVTLATAAV